LTLNNFPSSEPFVQEKRKEGKGKGKREKRKKKRKGVGNGRETLHLIRA
jgi:hypothetical protein